MNEESVFAEALGKKGEARAAFLDEHCKDDVELRKRLDALLRAADHPDPFLEAPVPAPVGTVAEVRASERPGTVIGPYKLLEQIGEGGMGTVWMAQQTEPVKRVVALKLIKAGMDSKQVIARFEAERQALALMDHANIARVLDGGTTSGGRPYFVMDLVKGVPITRYCDEHHLTPRQRLELFIPVCQAIQHAHQKGIIHRDLKPSNILVAPYDGKPVVKVIDFGVAKAAGQQLTDRTLVTGFGAVVGTLEYMSPEQAELNNHDIDTRSDIYALGVLLYELLAGSPPFTRKDLEQAGMVEMLRLIREQEPSKPSTKLSTAEGLPTLAANRGTEPAKLTKLVRGELDWIVMKALEKDRNRRYETANGFAMDVQRYLADEQVLACPASVGYRLRKFARRNKRGLVTAALLGVTLMAAVGVVAGTVGWMSRDRAARRLVVEEAATRALDEADERQKQGKWQEALAAAERAKAALASGEGGTDLQEQVAEQLATLRMIAQLQEIRAARLDYFDGEGANREYVRAFTDFGIDADTLSPAEIAARIGRRPATAVRMAAALDDWAMVRRDLGLYQKQDSATWKRLLEAARLADSDPWRSQLRQLLGREELNALRELADTSDITRLPVQSLQLMGNALVFSGDGDNSNSACVAWLRKAHRQHPGDVYISFDLAFHLANSPSRHSPEVLQFYEAALAARPQSAALHTTVGNVLFNLGRHDEGIAAYRRAIDLKPDYAEAHFKLGNAYSHLKQYDKAVSDYSKAIAVKPDFAKAHVYLGSALHAKGELDKAITAFRKAVELDARDAARAHCDLGMELKDQKKLDEAIAEFRTAIELDPKSAFAHLRLGWALHDQKKLEEAIAEYRKATELDPKDAGAHCILIDAMEAQGDLLGAVAVYEKAIAIMPDLAKKRKPAMVRARYYVHLSQWDKAAAEYAKAGWPRPLPEDACAYACLFLVRGDGEGYHSFCQQMIQRAADTHDPFESFVLARCCAMARKSPVDPARAVQWAKQALASAERGWYFHVVGLAQYRAGQFDQALQSFTESKVMAGCSKLNWFGLALVHHSLGHPDEARRCLAKGIQWLEQKAPPSPEQPVKLMPWDWLEALLLRREAEEMLKIKQSP